MPGLYHLELTCNQYANVILCVYMCVYVSVCVCAYVSVHEGECVDEGVRAQLFLCMYVCVCLCV